jgi:hypothetical protein
MKKIMSQLLCCAVLVLPAAATERTAAQARLLRIADPSPCQDSMETVPANDDLEPVLIAADISCKVPPVPISI